MGQTVLAATCVVWPELWCGYRLKIYCRVDIALSRSIKFKHIRDIAICEQNMATNRVKEISSKTDCEQQFLVLLIVGGFGLGNYQNGLWFASAVKIYLLGFRSIIEVLTTCGVFTDSQLWPSLVEVQSILDVGSSCSVNLGLCRSLESYRSAHRRGFNVCTFALI